MVDVVSPAIRSRMMSGIKSRNTKPELMIRKGLHRKGLRFRVKNGHLPGRPDIVFPRFRAVLFVHGCFWHRHECHLFKWPGSRQEFWREKLTGNARRDARNVSALLAEGWRVGIVWECALRGRYRLKPDDVLAICEKWVRGDNSRLELAGNEQGSTF